MEYKFKSPKDYDILERIGFGAFADVYRIKGKADGKFYAVKIVDLEKLNPWIDDDVDDEDVVRIATENANRLKAMAKREAEFMEKAQPHEHIVKVFGWFIEETIVSKVSKVNIVMELMDKGTLKDAIRAQKRRKVPFPDIQIANWAAQLAGTLKHLHNKRILHRDVKSENVFVTANNVLKLGDFGIAKSSDNHTTLNLWVCTSTHVAPEMLNKDTPNPVYDNKAEVWAFGVVMYEISQLKLPFLASNAIALNEAICSNPIPPITAAVSEDLRSLIITNLLDRNPATRFSMDQVFGHPCILNVIISKLSVCQTSVQPQESAKDQESQRSVAIAASNSHSFSTRPSAMRVYEWIASLFWQKEMEVALVGLGNSGKTEFVNLIAMGQYTEDKIPTVGFNMRRVKKGNVTIKIWDIGGQARFRSMWERYCRDIDAVVYMVDAADHDKLDAARHELFTLLKKPQLARIPVLVLGNNKDLPGALDVEPLIEKLKLKEIQDRDICCYSISPKEKHTIDITLQWLIAHSKSRTGSR